MDWRRLRRELETAASQEDEAGVAMMLRQAARSIDIRRSRVPYIAAAAAVAACALNVWLIVDVGPERLAVESVRVIPHSAEACRMADEAMSSAPISGTDSKSRSLSRAAARLCGLAGPRSDRSDFVAGLLCHPSEDVRLSAAAWYPFVAPDWATSAHAERVLSILAGE